jgi:hypothetical protein
MASNAQCGGLGLEGVVGTRILGVRRRRPMAGFASDTGVFSFALGFSDVLVTDLAHILAGKRDGPFANFVERGRAIVAQIAEGLRNDRVADQKKCNGYGGQDQRQPDKVLGLLEKISHGRLQAGQSRHQPVTLPVRPECIDF